MLVSQSHAVPHLIWTGKYYGALHLIGLTTNYYLQIEWCAAPSSKQVQSTEPICSHGRSKDI
jgi:hypothetical protein